MAARVEIKGEPSFLSVVSESGIQILVHVAVLRSGAIEVVSVTLDGEDAVRDAVRRETSRTRLRAELDEFAQSVKLRVGQAPGDYVAWRIHDAAKRHREAGRSLTPAQDRAVSRVPAVAAEPAHPAAALAPVADAERRVLESLGLHTEPEFRAWLPPTRAVELVSRNVQASANLVQPGDVATPKDPDDERAEVLRRSIDEFYDAGERRRLSRALRDAALVLASSRRHDRALDAVAVADAVDAASMFTTPPHKIPFVFGLFYKLAILQQQVAAARR